MDGEIAGHPRRPVGVEQSQHLVFSLVELTRGMVAALLERHDVEPGASELASRHAAARASADHHHIAVEVVLAFAMASLNDRWPGAHGGVISPPAQPGGTTGPP